jgi:hypothetical protein
MSNSKSEFFPGQTLIWYPYPAQTHMDPFSVIAGALATGAAAGLKNTTSKAIQDFYGVLKKLFVQIYQNHANVTEAAEHLAKKPTDEHRRKGLEGELKEAGVNIDPSLVLAADHLLNAVEVEVPELLTAVGVDIGVLKSKVLEFRNVNAPERGTAVRIREAEGETTVFKDIGGTGRPK